jgi:exonuclease SbcC
LYSDYCTKKNINLLNEDQIKQALKAILGLEDEAEIRVWSEDILIERVKDLSGLIEREKVELSHKNSYLQIKRNELSALENKEPSKYQTYVPEIERLIVTTQELERRFLRVFDSYIHEIINAKIMMDGKNEERKEYYNQISKFLANKIQSIRHIDSDYVIRDVDIVNKIFLTKEGKEIRFTDMGTGQSQSAYIMARLNTLDNRKQVVLLDEVAMMDEKSLKPILNKINELYKSGKLIIGIIVQKGEMVSITDLSNNTL